MHFVWFSMWDGFFSPRVSESRPSRVATRVGFGDEWWEIHLTWKTIQNAFSRILYTLRHFNQAKYTVQSCSSWKPCEMDLSHNCSLHGGMSEVCEKELSPMLRCVANDMNRWEIFPSLLISTSIFPDSEKYFTNFINNVKQGNKVPNYIC